MTANTATREQGLIRSTIPARIDRLPWNAFHTRLVVALPAIRSKREEAFQES